MMRKYQVRFGGGSVEKYLQRQLATFLPYTSLSRTNTTPARLLKIRRSHWGIETGLHGRRDVIFHEDATRMTVGNAGKVMASINNLVIALTRQAKFRNTAQARRWFAAHISEAFLLLTSPFSRLCYENRLNSSRHNVA